MTVAAAIHARSGARIADLREYPTHRNDFSYEPGTPAQRVAGVASLCHISPVDQEAALLVLRPRAATGMCEDPFASAEKTARHFAQSLTQTERLHSRYVPAPAAAAPVGEVVGFALHACADPRADIWALGVAMYAMTVGRAPFEGGRFIPPSQARPDLPPGFARALERCLGRDEGRRFQNVSELASALVPFKVASIQPRRALAHVLGVAAFVVMALASVLGAAWHWPELPPRAREPHTLVSSPRRLAEAPLVRAPVIVIEEPKLRRRARGRSVQPDPLDVGF